MGRGTRRPRPAAGGRRQIDVAPDRLPGWVNRFTVRNDGMTSMRASAESVVLHGANGTVAELAVPFAPLLAGGLEPVEALLDHLAGIGDIGMVLVRAGAHSVGVCRNGAVLASSTDTHYVQGRTAAGGWSQQRYARRRGNQRESAMSATADAAARLLGERVVSAMVLGGDRRGYGAVLADPRLARLAELPHREFPAIPEPRRAVLDDVAARSLDVTITLTDPAHDVAGRAARRP